MKENTQSNINIDETNGGSHSLDEVLSNARNQYNKEMYSRIEDSRPIEELFASRTQKHEKTFEKDLEITKTDKNNELITTSRHFEIKLTASNPYKTQDGLLIGNGALHVTNAADNIPEEFNFISDKQGKDIEIINREDKSFSYLFCKCHEEVMQFIKDVIKPPLLQIAAEAIPPEKPLDDIMEAYEKRAKGLKRDEPSQKQKEETSRDDEER